LQPVRRILVRAEDAKTGHVAAHHVAQKFPERFGGRDFLRARLIDGDGVIAKIREIERLAQLAAVGVRVGAHAAVARGRKLP
jgi:hypothetical protein